MGYRARIAYISPGVNDLGLTISEKNFEVDKFCGMLEAFSGLLGLIPQTILKIYFRI